MKTLQFHTNIDCPFRLQKAACGLDCLHGRYCQLSVDLVEATHLLTVKTESLTPDEVIEVLTQEGVWCESVDEPAC